ncbi:hypothetical protein KY289_010711 [Solanum tuberosum]|nr:hypothetical protein KY289_010711 [Solanum tuberosum]
MCGTDKTSKDSSEEEHGNQENNIKFWGMTRHAIRLLTIMSQNTLSLLYLPQVRSRSGSNTKEKRALRRHRGSTDRGHASIATLSYANNNILHYKFYIAGYRLLHYNSPASRRLYITSFTQPDTGFYITTAPPVEGLYITSFSQPDTGLYITTAPPVEGLYITSFTQPDTGFYITTAPPVEGLYITSYFTYITLTTQKEATKHYNEELPLSSKLGQLFHVSVHCNSTLGHPFENSSIYHESSVEIATEHFSYKFL